METLGNIVTAMAQACRKAGVKIATGDTKVVQKGHGDGIYINTSGIGVIPAGVDIGPANARPGDARAGQRDNGRPRDRHHVGARRPDLPDRDPVRYRPVEWAGGGDDGSRRLRKSAADPLPAGCHAWRAGGRAERTGRFFQSGHRIRRAQSAAAAGSQRGLRDARPGPVLRGQRGETGGDRAGRSRPKQVLAAMRSTNMAKEPPSSARWWRNIPAW